MRTYVLEYEGEAWLRDRGQGLWFAPLESKDGSGFYFEEKIYQQLQPARDTKLRVRLRFEYEVDERD